MFYNNDGKFFLDLKKRTEEKTTLLHEENSDFLKLKKLASICKDKGAVEKLRKRKLNLPKKYQKLFSGILKDDAPKVVAEKALRSLKNRKLGKYLTGWCFCLNSIIFTISLLYRTYLCLLDFYDLSRLGFFYVSWVLTGFSVFSGLSLV